MIAQAEVRHGKRLRSYDSMQTRSHKHLLALAIVSIISKIYASWLIIR